MSAAVAIIGVTIASGKPNRAGFRIVAFFDAEFSGLRLSGCALAKTPRNGFTVWPPQLEGPELVRRSVTIVDLGLRHALTEAARAAATSLGADVAWEPHATRAAAAGAAQEGEATA